MTLNISKPFPVIASIDPAIDTKAITEDQMLAYIHERDIAKLPIKPGERPAKFMLRELTLEQQEEIMSTSATESSRFVRAFRLAVVEVVDFKIEGQRTRFAPADLTRGFTTEETRSFRMSTIVDIGSVAWARSFLGPDIVLRFAPPPLLLGHLAALPYRPAVPSDAAQNKHTDSATQESAGRDGTKNGEPSASPIAVPATAETSHPAE